MVDKQKLEEKIGEALGLEMAAQKAVEEFESKVLLNKHGMKGRQESMKKEPNDHQIQIEQLVQTLSSQENWIPLIINLRQTKLKKRYINNGNMCWRSS